MEQDPVFAFRILVDIALKAFAGHRLFPYAAPTGGFVLIASWLGVASGTAAVPACASSRTPPGGPPCG